MLLYTVELPLLGHIGPAKFCPNKACVPIVQVFIFHKIFEVYRRPIPYYLPIMTCYNEYRVYNKQFAFPFQKLWKIIHVRLLRLKIASSCTNTCICDSLAAWTTLNNKKFDHKKVSWILVKNWANYSCTCIVKYSRTSFIGTHRSSKVLSQ